MRPRGPRAHTLSCSGHTGEVSPCGYTHLEVDVCMQLVVKTTSRCCVLFVTRYCMTLQLVTWPTSHCYDLFVMHYRVVLPRL